MSVLKAITASRPCRKIPKESIRAPFSQPRLSLPGVGLETTDVLATGKSPSPVMFPPDRRRSRKPVLSCRCWSALRDARQDGLRWKASSSDEAGAHSPVSVLHRLQLLCVRSSEAFWVTAITNCPTIQDRTTTFLKATKDCSGFQPGFMLTSDRLKHAPH